jgi:hypothetical protein
VFLSLLLLLGQEAQPLRPVLQAASAPEDLSESGRLFAEWHPQETVLYPGQSGRVRLVLGIEEALLREQSLPLFQARMDWSVLLRGALCLEQPGEHRGEREGLGIERLEPTATGVSLVLGETRVMAEQVGTLERSGHRYEAVALEWSVRSKLPGEHPLAEPVVRLAYATEFREDLLQGRVPIDRRDALWRGPRAAVRIRDWPGPGQPAGFRGALGTQLRLEWEAEPKRVASGDVLRLRVQLSNPGDLDPEVLPWIASRKGLDSISRSVASRDRQLVGEYELLVRDTRALQLPLAEWSYLELSGGEPRYVTQALQPALELVDSPLNEPASPSRAQWWFFLGSLGLLGAAGIVYLRRKPPIDPDLQRSRVALATLREQLKRPEARLRPAFELFLALRLGVPLSGLPRQALAEQLVARKLPPELAASLQTLLQRLEVVDFGAGDAGSLHGQVQQLAEAVALADEERVVAAAKRR